MSDVLVLYVEPFGPTAQVAMEVAEQLCRHGLRVELRRVGRAHTAGHRAVVLGGATGPGSWDPAALRVLRDTPPGVAVHVFHTAFGTKDTEVPDVVSALALARGTGEVPVLPDPDAPALQGRGPRATSAATLAWADELAGRLDAVGRRWSLVG